LSQTKRILVAPLNWGLGHATRCIPVIRELQRQGAEVMLASDGRALDLLKSEFPDLFSVEMPAYAINYRTGNMVRNMAGQLPKILRAVYREHLFTQKLIARHRLDGIVSDNRYGCFTKKIPCVFLTHQLNIRTPYPALSRLVNFFNCRFIEKFNVCWVPDVAGEPNLSGKLSHGGFQKKIRYVGALSRMKFFEATKKYDVIAVLSGPEPKRSHLERAILEQAARLPQCFLIVQGRTERQERFFIEKNVEAVSFLASEELNEAILASKIFIGRSGYSTIMDLAKLGIPALLVPTPGQTEQEYLAEKFRRQGVFLMQKQGALDLEQAMAELPGFSGLRGDFFDEKLLEKAVCNFLRRG
jgi:uncharacterized protein (TIGR00661 family)